MRVRPSTGPPVAASEERVIKPCLDLSRRSQAEADDPFPDYDIESVNLSSVALAEEDDLRERLNVRDGASLSLYGA